MAEELDPEVGEDALARPAGEVRLRVAGTPVRDPGEQERDDVERERAQVVRADAAVDRVLGEIRGREAGRRRGEQREHGEPDPALVRRRQPGERRDAAGGAPPRPVVDVDRLVGAEVAAGLPDPHALASTRSANCASSRPCS